MLGRRVRDEFQALVRDGVTGHYPLIILEVQREDPRLRETFERHNVPFNVALEVSTIDTLKHFVACGLGIAVVSGFAVTQEDRARLDIVAVPQEFGEIAWTANAAWLSWRVTMAMVLTSGRAMSWATSEDASANP